MKHAYSSCMAGLRRLGTLAVVLIGITGAFGLSACSSKLVTNTDGTTTTVKTFNTAELNLNVQAGLYALNAISDIPKVQTALKVHPDQLAQFNAAVTKIQDTSKQIAAVTNGTVELNLGKTWAKDIASELQTALSIASPIVGAVYPSAQQYVDIAEKLVPVVSALVQTFGQPAPSPALGTYGASGVMPPEAIRVRLYQGV